jgi:hypothetical protein
MKHLLVLLGIVMALLALSKPRVITITAHAQSVPTIPASVSLDTSGEHFSQFEIDEMLGMYANDNFTVLREIIKCESQNTNVARMDSNHLMSYGILQFNGTATWNTFAPLAGVTSSAMNPIAAVEVADWMVNHGQIGRWTCAHLLHLVK